MVFAIAEIIESLLSFEVAADRTPPPARPR